MAPEHDTPTSDRLVPTLVVEVFQAERSGAEHPKKEAARLGDTPPGRAMADLAADCALALGELDGLARPDLRGGSFGRSLGSALSALRDGVTDLVVTREASYRATLLGVHHGVDAIALLRAAAEHAVDIELVEWCMRTLDRREPLLERARHELVWFGRHPAFATEPAKQTLTGKAARVLVSGLGLFGLRARP